jgi:hypothetical protein
MMRWYRLGLIGALLVMTAAAVATFAERPAQPENSDQMVFLPIIARPQIPVIKLFQVQPAAADPGQTVTLSWEVEHADEVTLIRFWDFRPAQWWTDLPLVGSQEYTVPDWERNPVYFTLDAYDAASGVRVNAGVSIQVICPDTWFFNPAPSGCPTAPIYSAAAEQSFEGGYMIWLGVENRIIVLFTDNSNPKMANYTDSWAGEPICNLGPPPTGKLHPERGFGKIWCDFPAVRDRLGWATEPETGYETILQRTTMVKYNRTYLLAADDNVWHLLPENSGWEKIVTTP